MFLRQRLFLFALLTVTFCSIERLSADNIPDEKHVKVAIRMVGHEILLRTGDSISRVLPIEREGSIYILPFDTNFQFDPDELVYLVDSILTLSGLTNNYLVEVKDCGTEKVVYSFEIREGAEDDLIPCKNRIQPKACYVIYFSFLTKENPSFLLLEDLGTTESETEVQISNQKLSGYYLLVLFSLFVGGYFYYKIRSRSDSVHPDRSKVGLFIFDKSRMVLWSKNEIIELSSKEADLLSLLHQSLNKIVERDVLLHKVWGDEGDYVGRTLDVFISKLRKKLEADPQIKIVNVRGVGYKLVIQSE